MTRKGKENLTAYLFLSPILLFFAVFFCFAVGFSILISFKDWNMLVSPIGAPFVGLSNYLSLFSDPMFRSGLLNTVVFALIVTFASVILALFVAMALYKVRGSAVWRFVFFAPMITPAVAVGKIWSYLYNPSYGVINHTLGWLGIPGKAWLSDPKLVLPSIMIVAIWSGLGVPMLILTAGLDSIPSSYYDAARIDGSSKFRTFISITLPLLKPTTLFLLVTGLINAWQTFDLIYIMGGAAPSSSTQLVSIYMYNTAFSYMQMGKALAASVILFVISLFTTLLALRSFRKGGMESYYA
ncbi:MULTISPECIES: carbohydrate ABC transporter permease [unclassified Mesotoga]|uniref:carbohydrate ABC transporter permease n=1 Tax=unclassified Mesotoga TaxID=1184398 RepID=UPI0026012BA4|nr:MULTISPECIES: sugar ABC transporter permease [unclassified Mesotoga]